MFEHATVVIAEDTRVAGKLFSLLEIRNKPRFFSLHARSEKEYVISFLKTLSEEDTVVLVTDAGTPAISDPGSVVVHEFRNLFPEALVVPIPGPSAAIAALSVSGFPSSHYEFFGFVPHKKGRKTFFEHLVSLGHTAVFYESPHRTMKTLESLADVLPDRLVMIGREMTKQYEEYRVATSAELLKHYSEHSDTVRGEFVVVVAPDFFK